VKHQLPDLREKEAERRLRESEERYRSLFDKASDGVIIMSPDGKLIEVNESFARMHGYGAGELMRMNIRDLDTPETARLIPDRMRQLLAGEILAFEVEHRHKDGHVFPLEVSAGQISIGGESCLQCFHRDITERKRAEDARKAHLAFREGIVECAAEGICVCHDIPEHPYVQFTVWNSRMTEITGYTMEEINRLGWYQAVYPDPEVQGRAKDRMERMRQGDNLKGEDWEITRSDGTRRAITISTSTLQGSGGGVHVLGLFQDITDRKRAAEKLIYIMKAVESASDAIGISDSAGRHFYQNKALSDLFGYATAEELEAAGGGKVVVKDPEVAKEMFGNVLSGKPWAGELEMVTKCGRVFPAFERADAIKDNAGNIIGIIGIIADITERKRAEEEKRNLELQVQQAQKMESLGVLAGGVAHDFNNILMAVLGHSELALEEISPMSPARRNLTEISTAARRAADLCRQMLAYAGKTSFALERVDLRDLVEEMAHLLKTAISKKAILNLHLERGLPPIEADPSQIRQIVMNLIINASEAIGDRSGTITVSVGATRCDEESLRKTELHDGLPPGLYMHLEVTDTGVGMDAQTRSRIFEPFFSTKFTGRGLGLAAVLGIVRVHRGTLKVYSEPGKGTTFRILFPALENGENGARRNDSTPLADWRGKGTILLVDDEEILIALGARMLEHLGFTVLTAEDGLQAVDLYRERGKEIDLVLMDLTMPHMDGAEAFDDLRRLNPDVHVVVASGYSHEDVASRFGGKGLAGVLQKPYTLAKLRESLAGLLPKRL
jgi:PAS domain S-box-containing protein